MPMCFRRRKQNIDNDRISHLVAAVDLANIVAESNLLHLVANLFF